MKRTNSLFIIALLVASVAASVTTVSLVSAQGEDPVLGVAWEVVNRTNTYEHAEENSQWIFGPQPDVWIGYADNLTSIEDNLYRVEKDYDLLVNITIPKSFLGESNTLDTIHFWGQTHEPRTPIFVLEYNVTRNHWNLLSLNYQPGVEAPVEGNFIELDAESCEFSQTTDVYEIVFAISFIQDDYEGVFWTGMNAIDQNGHYNQFAFVLINMRNKFVILFKRFVNNKN